MFVVCKAGIFVGSAPLFAVIISLEGVCPKDTLQLIGMILMEDTHFSFQILVNNSNFAV